MNPSDPREKGGAQRSRPKSCMLVAEASGSQYGWRWESDGRRSKELFRYFYDCVQDARKHGCIVDFAEVAESLKSGRGPDA